MILAIRDSLLEHPGTVKDIPRSGFTPSILPVHVDTPIVLSRTPSANNRVTTILEVEISAWGRHNANNRTEVQCEVQDKLREYQSWVDNRTPKDWPVVIFWGHDWSANSLQYLGSQTVVSVSTLTLTIEEER